MTVNEATLLNGDGQSSTAQASIFMMESAEFVAANWKSILCVGFSNLLAGVGCLMFPVVATQLAEIFLTSLVFAAGVLNTLTICSNDSANTTQQSPHFWVGVAQIFLAALMYTNPFFTLTVLTFLVALTFMMLGSIQISIARRHRDRVAARALMIISGASAIIMSFIICLSMPTARWFTIGVLMGVNLINVGTSRIVLGLYGRKLASAGDDDTVESWRSLLDSDIV
ncbi:expressed unknown protein [Seminavis robusta]|uniref:Uncharacterized protein n=1 Tax=Seminavis robusta TaxID=568900 RepID=A0A9N8D676_9STRA|nr:expressed unknown protein [Seminavis robusta]|eukprot:Sro15_g011170.1 n/a (226) ;mRNA; f:90348-91025